MRRIKKSSIVWTLVTIGIFILLNYLIQFRILRPAQQISLYGIGINIILAVSLNMILGLSGLFSLGHAGFMSIGAYSVGVCLTSFDSIWGFGLGILVGVFLSMIVSLLVAIPTLRLKGDYLAIATLGAAEIIRVVILNLGDLTNGAAGMSSFSRFTTLPILYFVIILCIFVIMMLNNSRFGRAWKSIRDDELTAAAMGVNVTKYKVISFVLGALFASVAGSLYAGYFTQIRPEMFDFNKSIDILVIVVLGGMGSVTGSVIAAIVLGLVNISLQSFTDIRMILYALILIVMMIVRPGGILGSFELSFERRRKDGASKA